MHRIIAKLYAEIINLFHILVAILIALAFVSGLPELGVGNPMSSVGFLLALVGAVIGYVLLFGFVSVVIRMHQNMERMAAALDQREQSIQRD